MSCNAVCQESEGAKPSQFTVNRSETHKLKLLEHPSQLFDLNVTENLWVDEDKNMLWL